MVTSTFLTVTLPSFVAMNPFTIMRKGSKVVHGKNRWMRERERVWNGVLHFGHMKSLVEDVISMT